MGFIGIAKDVSTLLRRNLFLLSRNSLAPFVMNKGEECDIPDSPSGEVRFAVNSPTL